MDKEELKTKHPELYNQIVKDTRDEVNSDLEGALEQEKEKGAKAERERIAGINSIKVSGEKAEKIIQDALADPKQTKETVAVKLLEAQSAGDQVKIEQKKEDTTALEKKTDKINSATPSQEAEATAEEDKEDDKEAKAAAEAAGMTENGKLQKANN